MSITRRLERRFVLPEQQRYQRPLLLIHGAWHGAWCWEAAMQDFAARGFAVHAISLRGHGESDHAPLLNLCGVDDYLRDIRRALETIDPAPIVVGHSMGGFLMQHYIEQETLPGLVLLCSMPHTGSWRFLKSWVRHHPLALAETVVTLNGRQLVGSTALAHEAFFAPDMPYEQVVRYASRLGSESLWMAVESTIHRPKPRPGAAPTLVIAAERDRIFTLDEQRALAEAYGAEFLSVPEAAHDLMLDAQWPVAAAAIERAAAEWMA